MTKIIELRVSNFARLSAVSIRPDGALVQITGKNGQGKTSCLNAIWTALKGRAVAPAQPIHKGAEEARLQVNLGTMQIVRTFKRTKTEEITHDLKITMADGSRVGAKPQQMIDALLGDLSFNPLEFARLPAKDQFERVKALVHDFDFATNASNRQEAYDERTVQNAKAKSARAQAAGVVLPAGPKPKPVDFADVQVKLSAAIESNNKRASALQRQTDRKRERDGLLQQAADLRERADVAEASANTIDEQLGLIKVPAAVDINELTSKLTSAKTIQQQINLFDDRDRHEREAEAAEKLSARLTEGIERCDAAKREAIAKAKMPVSGLSFGNDEVLLNGLPFSQAALSEKLRTSIGIAMALNPDLRVMLVDEGSELDSESLALVAEMAEKNEYQVWVARVEESGKTGFVIEDGALKDAKKGMETAAE